MKKTILFLSLFCGTLETGAKSPQVQSTCKQLPMKSGSIQFNPSDGDNNKGSLIVYSADDKVFSMTSGEVIYVSKVTNLDKEKMNLIMIQFNKDSLITYSRLENISFKKGDIVKKGQLIGKATSNPKSHKNEVGILVSLKNKDKSGSMILPNLDVYSFIKNADN